MAEIDQYRMQIDQEFRQKQAKVSTKHQFPSSVAYEILRSINNNSHLLKV